MQKMQPQVEFKLIALLLLLLQATWCMSSMMRTGKDWNYFNVQHYDSPSHLMDNPAGMNNFEYVGYQTRCEQGGEPVCATNGRQKFYFENECKLESHNMKSLFQHGTVLERTDLERCSPNCETIKCPTVYQPVCAAPSEAAYAVHAMTTNGVTFGNLCEVRKHECVSQRAMRIVNQGVCRELKQKRRNRKNRNKTRKPNRVQPSIESDQNSSSNVHFLITTRADRMKAAINSSTTSASTTNASTTRASTTIASTTRTTSTSFTQNPTKAPMRFREYQYSAAPHVSVSQAENPYNIYNIPDVGKDYENIMDNELSVYVPEVGYVTDSPPSTTTEATTTTTAIITTTPRPTTTTTMAAATTTTTTLKPTTTTTPNLTTPKPIITTYIMTISPSPKRLISSTTSKASTTTKAPSWSSSVTTRTQPLQVTTSTTAKSSSITTTNAPLKTTESTITTKNLNVTSARVEITTTKPKPTTTISSTTSAMTTPLTTSSTTPSTTPSPTHTTTTIATKAKML